MPFSVRTNGMIQDSYSFCESAEVWINGKYPQYSNDRKQGAERNGGDAGEAIGWITGGAAGDQR
jgi:hypothetical protein